MIHDSGLEASVADARVSVPPTCLLSNASTIPHVHLELASTACVFTLAQARAGIVIPIDVFVDQDVDDFTATPYDHEPNAGPFRILENLAGGSESYCVCDLGLPLFFCPLQDGGRGYERSFCPPITLRRGVYPIDFKWDGRNWSGPSDVGRSLPEGATFPAGDYTLSVSAAPATVGDAGTPAALSATFLVRLVP